MKRTALTHRAAAALLAVSLTGCGAQAGTVAEEPNPAKADRLGDKESLHTRWACDAKTTGGFTTDPAQPIPGASLAETATALPFSDDFDTTETGRGGLVTWRDASGLVWQQYEYSHDAEGWWLERGRSCYGIG